MASFLAIAVLLAATDAYWGALQSMAWTTMLVNNLHRGSVTEAVEHTFDGRHPCCLCKHIAAARNSQKRSEIPPPAQKREFPPPTLRWLSFTPTRFLRMPAGDTFADSLPLTPPTPPPRIVSF
jgi:hypothetical protein